MMLDFENKKITIVLLIVVSLLGVISLNKDNIGMSVIDFSVDERYFEIKDETINLNSLTLKQKIGQMIFTLAESENKDLYRKMNIGGIYFWKKDSAAQYKREIDYFQKDMDIPFLVGLDLEGCWNPFDNFTNFPKFRDIKDETDAFKVGMEHGRTMRDLGFNINFSPVVDREDTIWECRSFNESVEMKSVYYIRGLQGQGVIATAKHYPGKTLVGRDPHKEVEYTNIEEEDLRPFEWAIKNDVGAIMMNHLISTGEVNSNFRPSVVSGNIIGDLKRDYQGLVLTDEVRMAGLKNYYADERKMYVDLVNAGNDVILDFDAKPWHIYTVVNIIENAVRIGNIREERIDEAVTKILKAKGFKVVKRKI